METSPLTAEYLEYRIGALLYMPATYTGIAAKIKDNSYPLTSICLCLEDSISDGNVENAEQSLTATLAAIRNDHKAFSTKLPYIFIRVRSPEQLRKISGLIADSHDIVTGYVLPKYDLTNCDEYIEIATHLSHLSLTPQFFMPIIESAPAVDLETRVRTLTELKARTDKIRSLVPNIRVGGNDFCNLFAVRRTVDRTIYDIGAVNSILCDIMTVFGRSYVVSAPVWEYFENGSSDWLDGLNRELALDRLNGFIGKTAIHPSQLQPILDSMRVTRADYDDARAMLDTLNADAVSKSADGSRMNERKVHKNWAKKTLALAEIYGVREDA